MEIIFNSVPIEWGNLKKVLTTEEEFPVQMKRSNFLVRTAMNVMKQHGKFMQFIVTLIGGRGRHGRDEVEEVCWDQV